MYIYLLKSFLCLLILLGFYKIFLENEKAHSFNRFFLIGSLVFSIVLPLISISYTTEIPIAETFIHSVKTDASNIPHPNSPSEFEVFMKQFFPYLIGLIYSCGLLFFGFRFFRNLNNLRFEIEQNQRLKDQSYILVLLRTKLNPYTFLNYIFLNKKEYEAKKIAREVLLHEKAHVDQKHTIDILIIEFLQVVFWMNPLFIWLKKAAKLNHEFLADQQVISEIKDVSEYSNILFQYAGGSHQVSLSSSINYSLTKKRIIMISKSFSIKNLLLKIGLFIPVLGCCIFFFTDEIVAKPVFISPHTSLSPLNSIKTEPLVKLQEEHLINIEIEDGKIWVNGAVTSLQNFSDRIDEITKDWTEAELNDADLHIQTHNSDKEFMDELNNEFRKTRFYKVTGHDILPPPPPMPPSAAHVAPAPPAPPQGAGNAIPPAPPAPNVNPLPQLPPHERSDSLREMAKIDRERIRLEMDRIRELENRFAASNKMTEEERQKFQEEAQRKREEMQVKMEELQQRRVEIEKHHEAFRRDRERMLEERRSRIDSIQDSDGQ